MLEEFKRAAWKSVELVNPQGKLDKRARAAMVPRVLMKTYLEECRRAEAHGLTLGSLSEASLRLPSGKLLINAAGTSLARLREEDLCFIALDKEYVFSGNQPTVRAAIHRAIYNILPNAHAALLCQPHHAVLCASRKIVPNVKVLPDLQAFAQGIVRLEKAEDFNEKTIEGAHSVLLQGVGLLSWAAGMAEAVDQAMMVERLAAYSVM
jgi:ribulose-5-phosphate 4-epimerase/fuculose-1-phosphate aldolase